MAGSSSATADATCQRATGSLHSRTWRARDLDQVFSRRRSAFSALWRRYGAGARVVAFQRSTTEAVVVLSVLLKPGTGSFEKRSRYASFNARRAFIAACAVSSTPRRSAAEFLKSGYNVTRCVVSPPLPHAIRLGSCRL